MNSDKILIVEDVRFFSNLIKDKITSEFGYECTIANNFQEAKNILTSQEEPFMLAVLDLHLPDAPHGEIVEYVSSKKIPSIVATALINDNVRDQIMTHNVLDYIIKEGKVSLDQLTETIRRFVRNNKISILVVDDSGVQRMQTRRILEKQNFSVFEAANGQEALDLIKDNNTIRLVITDYNMPVMDGFEFVSQLRNQIKMDELAVIGLSAVGNPVLSAKFLKKGANDFVTKPYHEEEFIWRINQNIEILDNILKLKEAVIKDHLTGLHNRRHFFSAGTSLFENAKRKNIHIAIAMLDIDHFKNINDTYGHDVGDQVLKHLSQTLKSSFRASDIVARYGGEEFIIMTVNMAPEKYPDHFENLRKKIEETPLTTAGEEITFTSSIGVTTQQASSLEKMIKEADTLLYQAKNSGRNRVLIQ